VYLHAQVLCLVTEGVVQVCFLKKREYGGKSSPNISNVQHAIAEYDSHRSAARALRFLISEKKELWGKGVVVDWAKPKSHSKVSFLGLKYKIRFSSFSKELNFVSLHV
jgi:hypothetical protein